MGIFDFFKRKDYNKKNKKLDFDFDSLVITAYLLKEIAEIDGEFADSEKKFLREFLNINNIAEKDFYKIIDDSEKLNKLFDDLKYFGDHKKGQILGLIVEMLNIDDNVDDTELNYLVELIMRHNFSANYVTTYFFNATKKMISFNQVVRNRISFYQNEVPKADTKKIYKLNNEASDLFLESNFEEAIKKYNEILEIIPRTEFNMSGGVAYAVPDDILNGVIVNEVYLFRGKCHYEVKNYEMAISDFKSCIKESRGKNFDASHMLGVIKFSQGKIIEALENFNYAISANKESYASYYMRSICHANSDNPNRSYEKAILDIDFFLDNNPDDDAANQLKLSLESAGEMVINNDGIMLTIGGDQSEKILKAFEEINELMKLTKKTNYTDVEGVTHKEFTLVEGDDKNLKIAIEKIDLAINLYNRDMPFGLGDKTLSLPHLYFMRAQCQLQLASDDMDRLIKDLANAIIISDGKYIPDQGLGYQLFYLIKEKIKY